MYRYDEFDHRLVSTRVEQFRGQVERRLSGALDEDEFKPLRLMNGLYLQLHAYMLRVAVPYGVLSSRQMRMLAHIARVYDKGYGHFTTRQNIQYNWPRLEDVPDILQDLASVEMHAMQTSGNCIRNVTADHYAGATADELEDPRICSEIIRQWSTLHPEFSFLPRKFKIAVTGSPHDRAAIRVHDIGVAVVRNGAGDTGYQIYVGGGQGRTPMIAEKICDFLPPEDLLSYLESILRVYNRYGRRDNLYKARIKILVHALGAEEMRHQVEEEFAAIRTQDSLRLPEEEMSRIEAYFAPPSFEDLSADTPVLDAARAASSDLADFIKTNVSDHRMPGYKIVNVSLKPTGGAPGDASADQMDALAEMTARYSFDEIRVTHEQNLTLPHVRAEDIPALYESLRAHGLASANIGLVTDQIACPGLDFCNLANARSIPLAQNISERFADLKRQHDIGALKIKISGCINACGHHHVGHIGILGVDKKGTEHYQLSLGGSADENTSLAAITGPSFTENEIVDAVETVVDTYITLRHEGESFIETYRRCGMDPFKEKLYGTD
ncbi:MAG: nitrite/sulfite reductase [Parvularculales bacterium]